MMNPKVQEIKKLLMIHSFVLTNKGRLPMTKVCRTVSLKPSDVKKAFGEPINRWGNPSYIFKSQRTVSNLILEGDKGIAVNSDFWSSNSVCKVKITTSSQKLIDEFIDFLKTLGISST